ncbi:MAG TPA: OB-fold domain-containing protein, partial [Dehalococcoidia bacterium]|nr:OB-fold domain-containing protein [Dehalococcoidia bacterium]
RVHYGPLGFEADAPYVLGIVKFPEGVNVMSRVSKSIKVEDIKIGMELGIAPLRLNEEKITYEFVA